MPPAVRALLPIRRALARASIPHAIGGRLGTWRRSMDDTP